MEDPTLSQRIEGAIEYFIKPKVPLTGAAGASDAAEYRRHIMTASTAARELADCGTKGLKYLAKQGVDIDESTPTATSTDRDELYHKLIMKDENPTPMSELVQILKVLKAYHTLLHHEEQVEAGKK